MINPNNILVNQATKQMNYIDLPLQEVFEEIEAPKNSVYDMICILCDSLMQKRYFDVLSATDKDKLYSYTSEVIQKCKKAAEITGLGVDRNKTAQAFEFVEQKILEIKKADVPLTKYFNDFCEIYSDRLP